MILIGQTIMSPNGDRNTLTQCEFSVDFSFLRSLRASQLDAIYYILELLPNTVNAITSTVEQVDSDQCDLLSEKLRKSL